MNITLTALSILVITALAYGIGHLLRISLCPICAGVATTWLGMLGANIAGYPMDPRIIALLMGGTVVGIAYRTERHLASERSPLLWKTLSIPTGFVAAYALLTAAYAVFAAAVGLLLSIALLFFLLRKRVAPPTTSDVTAKLEERMKQCC